MFILCIFDEDEGGCAGDYGRERGYRSQELLYCCFDPHISSILQSIFNFSFMHKFFILVLEFD